MTVNGEDGGTTSTWTSNFKLIFNNSTATTAKDPRVPRHKVEVHDVTRRIRQLFPVTHTYTITVVRKPF